MNANGQFSFSIQSPTPDKTAGPKRTLPSLSVLAALLALAALTGCASVHSQASNDPAQYNPKTGYPAVGADETWHL